MNLKRIAQLEGRTEQDILRDSLRMYVRSADEQKEFFYMILFLFTNSAQKTLTRIAWAIFGYLLTNSLILVLIIK